MHPEKNTDKIIETKSTALSKKKKKKTFDQEILMQTLTVCLRNKNKEILIRALIDSGSQKSYLMKEVINKIGYTSIGQQKLNHSLFGGLQQTREDNMYRIFLSNLNSYFCNFEAYDQEKICAQIAKIRNGSWVKEARNQGIFFSDYENNERFRRKKDKEKPLVNWSKRLGEILEWQNKIIIQRIIVASETHLGWTLMGKPDKFETADRTNVVLSLHLVIAQISDLWRFNTLGIFDPGQRANREELVKAAKEHFNCNIRIFEDGRHEISLLWINKYPSLLRCYS